MADDQFTEYMKALQGRQISSDFKIRIATKRTKHSKRLADRVIENAELADKLVEVIKQLTRVPETADQVDRLIDITKQLLENNAKLKEQMGEAVQDIPD